MRKEDKARLGFSLFFDWLIRMIVYGAIIIVLAVFFRKTIHIDINFFGLWSFLLAVIIYGLNKTIRPLLVWITWPITGITMGIFYPFINVIILNIADFLLGSHFNVHGIFMTCFIGLLIGFFNMLMDKIIIKVVLRKE